MTPITPLPTEPPYSADTEKERGIALQNVIVITDFIIRRGATLPPEELALWKLYLAHMEGVHESLTRLAALWLTGSSELPQTPAVDFSALAKSSNPSRQN